MKYNCALCNYFTDDRKNYSHHKKTKKHQEKVSKQNELSNTYLKVIQELSSEEKVNIPTSPPITADKPPITASESETYTINLNELQCNYCKIQFTRKDTLVRHINKRCLNKKLEEKDEEHKKVVNEVKIESIMKEKELIQKQLEKSEKEKEELKKELNIIKNNINSNDTSLNNQLIAIIANKNNKIDELNNITLPKKNNEEIIIQENKKLVINDITVISRSNDNYVNATMLCKAGNKKFFAWYRLDNTKNLISELASEERIHASLLIDIKKGNSEKYEQGSWIHPKLAIHLAQWISPQFAIQVSSWIIDLLTKGKVEINLKYNSEIKEKDNKIKKLENLVIQKQKREEYPEKNVIYIITTEDNKQKGIYIVGKAKELTNRLSTYNKTCEHEVVYYKECKNEKYMNLIESLVLSKLDEYREKANRDRFILPKNKDITLFKTIIDESIEFVNK